MMPKHSGQSGYIMYKCRRCGEIYENTFVSYLLAALVQLENADTVTLKCGTIARTDIHICEDRTGVGVADYIGGTYVHSDDV